MSSRMHFIMEPNLTCVDCSPHGLEVLQSTDVQESKVYGNDMSVKCTTPIMSCCSWSGQSVRRLHFYMNCSQVIL